MSRNRQLASNNHDPTVCPIPPLLQYSPHLTFSLPLRLSPSYICESLFCSTYLSTFCDFDVPPLCEARSQLKSY
nr:hypothetical transcript [Hymenolepis microstoma]